MQEQCGPQPSNDLGQSPPDVSWWIVCDGIAAFVVAWVLAQFLDPYVRPAYLLTGLLPNVLFPLLYISFPAIWLAERRFIRRLNNPLPVNAQKWAVLVGFGAFVSLLFGLLGNGIFILAVSRLAPSLRRAPNTLDAKTETPR